MNNSRRLILQASALSLAVPKNSFSQSTSQENPGKVMINLGSGGTFPTWSYSLIPNLLIEQAVVGFGKMHVKISHALSGSSAATRTIHFSLVKPNGLNWIVNDDFIIDLQENPLNPNTGYIYHVPDWGSDTPTASRHVYKIRKGTIRVTILSSTRVKIYFSPAINNTTNEIVATPSLTHTQNLASGSILIKKPNIWSNQTVTLSMSTEDQTLI